MSQSKHKTKILSSNSNSLALLIPGLTVVGEGEQYFSMILKLFKNIVHKSGLVGEHI
jgi:hypothetical protein